MRSTVTTLTVAVLLLVGCGSSSSTAPIPNGEASKTAVQVRKDVEKSLAQVSSVHYSGTFPGSTGGQIHVDATSVPDKGGTASVTGGDAAFKLISIDDEVYVRGNKAFWGSTASRLRGRWLKCSLNSVVGEKASFTAPQVFLNVMYHGFLRNKGEKTYHGEKAVEIHSSRGAKVYVAATGPPYPLAVVAPGGAMSFDRYNAAVSLTAPKNAISSSRLCRG